MLHYVALHHTTLHCTTLRYTTLQLQLQLTTTTPLQLHYTTLHPTVVVRWPLQPLQPLQKTQLQPPFGPSVDSLCHPWFTTTNLSYRLSIFETSATALCGTTGISSSKTNYSWYGKIRWNKCKCIVGIASLSLFLFWILRGWAWILEQTVVMLYSQHVPRHGRLRQRYPTQPPPWWHRCQVRRG